MAVIEERRSKSGSTFHVKVRIKGHPPQYATFKRLTDARRWIQSTESAIREGRHFKTAEAKKHTLADAIKRYRKEVLPHKMGCMRSQPRHLDWWETELGAYALADLTPALIGEKRDQLANSPRNPRRANAKQKEAPPQRAKGTVNRYLATLSHVLSTAVKEWAWMEDNPVRKVRKFKEAKGRDRYLSDDERTKLLEACRQSSSPFLYTVVVLALSTGMRRGEILTLRWKQIDLIQNRITLTTTKNGETRSLPLASIGRELLADLKRENAQDGAMVFPGKTSDKPVELKKSWGHALTSAEITNFRFHDLRHSAASYLAMNGASLLEIAAVLGHKTLSMVKRYSHLNDAHTRRVVEAMNDKIFGKEIESA